MLMQFDIASAPADASPFQLAFEALSVQLRAITGAISQLDFLELEGGGNQSYIDSKRADLRMKYNAKVAERDQLLSIGQVSAGPTAEQVRALREAVERLATMNVNAAAIKGIVDELVAIAGAYLYQP
jgi:hypothetical protein